MSDNLSTSGVDVQFNSIQRQLDQHEKKFGEIWDTIDKIRDRLPTWAVVLFPTIITLITGLSGYLLRMAIAK